MNRYLAIAFALSGIAVALALASGAHRRAALVGVASACITGIASMMAMARSARSSAKPAQAALAVMAIGFLIRLVVVGVGTLLVVRAGESIAGFVVAFFVPYFALAIVEAAQVHSLRRVPGTPR